MADLLCLDNAYSTTRLVTRDQAAGENPPVARMPGRLFLPPNPERQGEGGLRTKGYFKQSLPDKPLVSVITVVFNGEQHLEETIQSVVNQTYDNVEYIIIDGGSTDGTLEIINKYDEQIDYWVSEADRGLYDAMNKGISLTTGEWLNFINCGDLFFDRSSLSNNLINYNDKVFIYSDTLLVDNLRNKNIKVFNCDHQDRNLIHQSTLYKRFLHFDYGYYIVFNKFLLADYFFFTVLPDDIFFKSDYIIAKYDINGNSNAGHFEHVKDKFCIDLLFNKISAIKFIYLFFRISLVGKIKNVVYQLLISIGAYKFAYRFYYRK